MAQMVLDEYGVTAERHGAIVARLREHGTSLTDACEAESAALTRSMLTSEGWLVTPPPVGALATVYAAAALLAADGDNLAAAVECQKLADHAFKLVHTRHVVDGAQQEAEREVRKMEAARRSAAAKHAASVPRKGPSDERLLSLCVAWEATNGARTHGRRAFIHRSLTDAEAVSERALTQRLKRIGK